MCVCSFKLYITKTMEPPYRHMRLTHTIPLRARNEVTGWSFAIIHRDSTGNDHIIVGFGFVLVVVALRTLRTRRVNFTNAFNVPGAMASMFGTDTCFYISKTGMGLFNVHTLEFEQLRETPRSALDFKVVAHKNLIEIMYYAVTIAQPYYCTHVVYDSSKRRFVYNCNERGCFTTYEAAEGLVFGYHNVNGEAVYAVVPFGDDNVRLVQREERPPPRVLNPGESAARDAHTWPPMTPTDPFLISVYDRNGDIYVARRGYENEHGVDIVRLFGTTRDAQEMRINYFYVPRTRTLYVVRDRNLYVYDLFVHERAAVLATLGDPAWMAFWGRAGGLVGSNVFRYFE